jgi:hypothetical protein
MSKKSSDLTFLQRWDNAKCDFVKVREELLLYVGPAEGGVYDAIKHDWLTVGTPEQKLAGLEKAFFLNPDDRAQIQLIESLKRCYDLLRNLCALHGSRQITDPVLDYHGLTKSEREELPPARRP